MSTLLKNFPCNSKTPGDITISMANTYSKIYVQIVFAVEGRQNLIKSEHKEELQKYITGIITQHGQKMIALHCMPDHSHILVGLKPSMALSDLVREIKTGSTLFINKNKWVSGRFSWQEGFGAFSYSESHLSDVIKYIENQEEHHRVKSFSDEYRSFLERFKIEYDTRYILKGIEDYPP